MIYRVKIRNNKPNLGNAVPLNNGLGSFGYTGITINPPFQSIHPTYLQRDEELDIVELSRELSPENPLSPEVAFRLGTVNTPVIPQTSGDTITRGNWKHITVPLSSEFEPVGKSELIDGWVYRETRNAINRINNGETVKYYNYPGIKISFRFYDKNSNLFDNTNVNNGYQYAGFLDSEINVKNNFKKSFFRLYFYDSGTGNTRNLLFTEDLDVFGSTKPSFDLNRLYWLRDDEYYLSSSSDRIFYMEARFFNAKTGRVHKFINPPVTLNNPMNITTYADPANKSWRTSPVKLKNPFFNSGRYEFEPVVGVGGNQSLAITMTEYVLV